MDGLTVGYVAGPDDEAPSPPPAFAAYYRACYGDVAKALTLTLGDRDLAAEAADEAMVRTYQRWEQVRGYDSPAGWTYRVGLNWARSVLRRRRREAQPIYRQAAEELPAVADPQLHAALGELDLHHRAVVVCRYLLDWSVEDTAAALHVRPGTVKSRLHRALRALEAQLEHLR